MKRQRGSCGSASIDAQGKSLEDAVVEFIVSQENVPGEGLWLQHIHSQEFQHKDKPSKSGSKEKLYKLLQDMSSLVEGYDDKKQEITFKVRATDNAESWCVPTAIDSAHPPTALGLVQDTVHVLDLALQCHEYIEQQHLTPSQRSVVVPIKKWNKLKQYMIEARLHLSSENNLSS